MASGLHLGTVTACFPARAKVAVLEGVPANVDQEEAAVQWATAKAVGDEELLVAFKIDGARFEVVRRSRDGLEHGIFAVSAG